MPEHEHFCGTQSEWPHKEGLGCTCGEPGCTAVYHVLGWQEIATLPSPEPEFDLDEFRTEVQSLLDGIEAMMSAAPISSPRLARLAAKRCAYKNVLDLLPKKVTQ